jgi:filamentous hemagglutinin family protein
MLKMDYQDFDKECYEDFDVQKYIDRFFRNNHTEYIQENNRNFLDWVNSRNTSEIEGLLKIVLREIEVQIENLGKKSIRGDVRRDIVSYLLFLDIDMKGILLKLLGESL